jgi:hypothetical protein
LQTGAETFGRPSCQNRIELPLDVPQACFETINPRCLTGNLQLQMTHKIVGKPGNRLRLWCGYSDTRDVRASGLLAMAESFLSVLKRPQFFSKQACDFVCHRVHHLI